MQIDTTIITFGKYSNYDEPCKHAHDMILSAPLNCLYNVFNLLTSEPTTFYKTQ